MKKSISLVLCLAMLVSVFSCLGVVASAVSAQDLFTVKSSGFKNDKITYTIYLNAGVNLSGAIIYAKFDSSVLAIDKANSGAYMTTDSYGDECQNIDGMYEADFMAGYDDQFSIAHAYGQEADYKAGSSNKAYMQFTFNAIDANRPATTVKFYCYEFNSASIPDNNIANGSSSLVFSETRTTLGTTVLKEISSEQDGVKITWEKVTGADFYRVYKKIDGEFEIINETEDGSVTSYVDSEVKNNTSYTYAVRAVNEASDAGYAATRSSALTTTYTVAPKTLSLSNGEGVTVEWSKVTGATGYRVYRRTVNADGTTSSWKYLSKKITALTYADTTAKSGTTYEYAVRVYSDGGNSALYSEKKIVYLEIPGFTVASTVKGVKISWDKVNGATGYKIYRKVKGGSWKAIKTASASATSYTDTGATSGKTIYYRVKAINGSYVSGYEGHNLSYLKTPEASVKNTTSGVKVSWDKVGGATSYYVYRKAGSAKSWSKIATTKNASYTDKNVKSGTTYKYCVRAVNSSLKSKYGSSSYETIKFLSAPKLGSIKSSKSGVTITWNKVTGASGYVIYRQTGSGKYKELATVSGKSTVKYVDKSAEKGTTYSYRVYATYGSYKSSYKSSLSIKDKY